MLVGVLNLLLITMVFLKIPGYSYEKYKNLEHPSNQNHSQSSKTIFLPRRILKTTIEKLQTLCIQFNFIFDVIQISFECHLYITRMSFVFAVCPSYGFVCNSFVTRMSSVCHSYVTRLWFDHELLSVWNCCSCSYIFCNFSFW